MVQNAALDQTIEYPLAVVSPTAFPLDTPDALCYTHFMAATQDILEKQDSIFLTGRAGTGKTTLAVERLIRLIETGVPGDSILVLAPQRSLLRPYWAALRKAQLPPGTRPSTLTLAGLARQMVELYWPVVAPEVGFERPDAPPVYLTIETAQYYLERVVGPLMTEAGYFEGIRLPRPRVYSQILDNLNKAALVGFSHMEIGDRLKAAWTGQSQRAVIFTQVQDAAARFREFCLQNNLLDFSLLIEAFVRHLWPRPELRDMLVGRYRHLIADNVEEEPPVTHDVLREWIPRAASALVVYDDQAGYRVLLGADPAGGASLREVCRETVELAQSHILSPDMAALAVEMARRMEAGPVPALPLTGRGDARSAINFGGGRFHTEMLDWVSDQIAHLAAVERVPPGHIAVLSPFLSDSLRFALSERLKQRGIPTRTLRPSRSINDEPSARALIVLAKLAHPDWGLQPALADVAHALAQVIEGLDEARAYLVAQRAYAWPELRPFANLKAILQDRIGFSAGERYERLREWIAEYRAGSPVPLDHMLSRLFGEIVSQPGYGFHRNLDAGRASAELIDSARGFRQVIAPESEGLFSSTGLPVGPTFIEMVESNIIAARHPVPEPEEGDLLEAVLLAPAYTFLLLNQPVDVQFWINAGSLGWWERLNQPLTHPFVLTRAWPAGAQWTDEQEQLARRMMLYRLTQGLIHRCRSRIYLGFSVLNEQGFEERGPLMGIVQGVLRAMPAMPAPPAPPTPSAPLAQPAPPEDEENLLG